MRKSGPLFSLLLVVGAAGHTKSAGRKDAPHQPIPHKRALLVAVNGYARGRAGDARELDTCADAAAFKQVLMRPPFRFAEKDITILQRPEETTGQAIHDAFYNDLIKPTHPGDVVVFHFSGHGSQVADPTDDRYGYDQTLVPSDYVSKFDGSRDIRDKQIAGWLKDLARKRPGATLLIFDSCHSGGVTRDGDGLVVRGFDREIQPRKGGTRGDGEDEATKPLLQPGDAPDLPYVALAACRFNQVAVEIPDDGAHPRRMGGLTYALCRALSQIDSRTTYRDLLQRIVSVMREKRLDQDPQIEGPIDTVLLGKDVIRPEPGFLVDLNSHGLPVLQAGFLQGITEGTKLDLYAAGAEPLKRARLIGHATALTPVSTATPLQIELVKGALMKELRQAHAVVRRRAYGDSLLHVDLAGCPAGANRVALIAALRELEHDELATTRPDARNAYDVRLVPAARAFSGTMQAALRAGRADAWTVTVTPGGIKRLARRLQLRGADPTRASSLVLQKRDGSLLTAHTEAGYVEVLEPDGRLAGTVRESLRHEARRALLFKLASQDHDPTLQVRLRLIPCETDPDPDNPEGRLWNHDLPVSPDVIPAVPLGSDFRVEVQNPSLDPISLTVLDVAADGMIGPLWPGRKQAGIDNVFPHCKEGEWKPLRVNSSPESPYALWHLGEPLGNETLLAIATAERSDFSALCDPTRDASDTREGRSPLGRLIRNAALSRDATTAVVDEAGWGVCSLPFRVVGKTASPAPVGAP